MNKRLDLELVVFFFSILFLPKIGLLDLKMIACLLFICVSFMREPRLRIDRKFVVPITILCLLIILFLVNSLSNETDYLILFRYFRCLLSLVCINNYLYTKKPGVDEAIQAVSFVILIHAISVIISVLVPSSRPIIEIISRYSKKYLSLRSTGLVSGYDFAGLFLNVGLVLRIIYNVKEKNKVFDPYCLTYVIAVLFTSRLNTMLLLLEIALVIVFMVKTQRIKGIMSLFIIIPIVLAGSIFTILTIDAFEIIKDPLVHNYQWIANLDRTINLTYADSNFTDVIESHYAVDSSINKLVGNGVSANHDPGIIKTIYEGGVVAIILKYIFYLYLFLYSAKRTKYEYIFTFLTLYILIISLFEFKLLFYFATGSFELLIAFFVLGRLQESRKEYAISR